MLANKEKRQFIGDFKQKLQGAKVAVGHPQVPRADRLQDVVQQRALLRMPVGSEKHIAGQVEFGIHDDQDLARQRRRPGVAQRFQAMLRRRQVIAIENERPIARQPRRTPRLQFVDRRSSTLGRITHHGRRHFQFHAVELVVNRIVAHRQKVSPLAKRGEHRRFGTQDNRMHQLDHRREQQVPLILLDRRPSKQFVQLLRLEESLDNGPGHDANGSLLNKRCECSCQHPCHPHRRIRKVCEGIV
jgi:hypothetical protein